LKVVSTNTNCKSSLNIEWKVQTWNIRTAKIVTRLCLIKVSVRSYSAKGKALGTKVNTNREWARHVWLSCQSYTLHSALSKIVSLVRSSISAWAYCRLVCRDLFSPSSWLILDLQFSNSGKTPKSKVSFFSMLLSLEFVASLHCPHGCLQVWISVASSSSVWQPPSRVLFLPFLFASFLLACSLGILSHLRYNNDYCGYQVKRF